MIYGRFDADGRPLGFFDSDIHGSIPVDGQPLSDAQWQELLSDPARKRFVGGQVVTLPVPLDELKAVMLARIQALRIAKAEGGIQFAGQMVPTDKEAMVLILSAKSYLGKKPGKTFKKAGLGEFNLAALDALETAIGDHVEAIYSREAELYDLIMAATSASDLAAIDIESGW